MRSAPATSSTLNFTESQNCVADAASAFIKQGNFSQTLKMAAIVSLFLVKRYFRISISFPSLSIPIIPRFPEKSTQYFRRPTSKSKNVESAPTKFWESRHPRILHRLNRRKFPKCSPTLFRRFSPGGTHRRTCNRKLCLFRLSFC